MSIFGNSKINSFFAGNKIIKERKVVILQAYIDEFYEAQKKLDSILFW